MAKVIAEIQDWADVKLRRLCGRITPDQRVVVILVMFVVFGGLSVYMTVAASTTSEKVTVGNWG